MTRWNLTIGDETDRLVRSHLAQRGMKKGDLSRFVDYALKRAVFWESVDEARAFAADEDPAAIEAAIDSALKDVRAGRS